MSGDLLEGKPRPSCQAATSTILLRLIRLGEPLRASPAVKLMHGTPSLIYPLFRRLRHRQRWFK